MSLPQYEAFLPGGTALEPLLDWLRTYLSFELEWDATLVLERDAVPETHPGDYGRLGWTTWLGKYTRNAHADDLHLDPEALASRLGRVAVNASHNERSAA